MRDILSVSILTRDELPEGVKEAARSISTDDAGFVDLLEESGINRRKFEVNGENYVLAAITHENFIFADLMGLEGAELLVEAKVAVPLRRVKYRIYKEVPFRSPSSEAQRLGEAMGEALPIDFDALVPGSAGVRKALRDLKGKGLETEARRVEISKLLEDGAFKTDAVSVAFFKAGWSRAREAAAKMGPQGTVFVALTGFRGMNEAERAGLFGELAYYAHSLSKDAESTPRVVLADETKDGAELAALKQVASSQLGGLFQSERVLQRTGGQVIRYPGTTRIHVKATLAHGDLASQGLADGPIHPVARAEEDIYIEDLKKNLIIPLYLKDLARQIGKDIQQILLIATQA